MDAVKKKQENMRLIMQYCTFLHRCKPQIRNPLLLDIQYLESEDPAVEVLMKWVFMYLSIQNILRGLHQANDLCVVF